MITDDNKNLQNQELSAALEQMCQNLYKTVDNAVAAIARICVNLTPTEVAELMWLVFGRMYEVQSPAGASMPQTAEIQTPAVPKLQPATQPKTPAKRGRSVVWSESSDASLRQTYYMRRKAGRDIEPELAAELARRFPGYDAATQTFIGKLKNNAKAPQNKAVAGKRPKSLAELADQTIKNMYYKMRSNGISAELDAELARRFPAYNQETHKFVKLYRGEHIATSADIDEIEHQMAMAEAMRRQAEKEKRLAPAQGRQAANTDTGDLVVTTELLKITQDGPYYDVFVNGNRILHNHIGTQVQTFLNGTVLGVYGSVTDIPNFPDKPSWQVYDTNMKRRTFNQVQPFSKKSVFIKNITKIGETQIRLEVSNKMLVTLNQHPVQRVFKISSEKQK